MKSSKDNLSKVFIINGGDAVIDINNGDNFYALANLNYIIEFIEIGHIKNGFYIEQLTELFKDNIDSNAKTIDIIVNMHGGHIDGEYKLLSYKNYDQQKKEFVEIKNFIQTLIKATNNIKLNLLFISCFGANIIDAVEKLPISSKIITFSDKDKESNINEDRYENAETTNLLIKRIFSEDFKLEYFLELHCFNQKIYNNTPCVSIFTEQGIKKVDFEFLKEKYVKSSYLYSPFVEEMFKQHIFSKSNFDYVRNKLTDYKLEEIKPPHNLKNLVLENYEKGTLENLKQDWGKRYYFNKDLDELEFTSVSDLNDNEDDDIPIMYLTPKPDTDLSIIDGLIPQHSIALGLIVDYAINNGEL